MPTAVVQGAVLQCTCGSVPTALIVTSQAQVRATLTANPLHRMPLSVVTHGIPGPPPPGIDNWPVAADEKLWNDLQDELAALEPGSHHVVAAQSDHDIPLNQPALVIAEVTRVIRLARGG